MAKNESNPEQSNKTRGMLKKVLLFLGFKGIVSIFILIILVIFCLQNIESTSIQFLFWKILEVSKLYLIILSIIFGLIVGLAFGFNFKKN